MSSGHEPKPTTTATHDPNSTGFRGLALCISAYGFWGLVPLYWTLLDPAPPVEVIAHRVVWSLVFVSLAVTGLRLWQPVVRALRSPRTLALSAVTAIAVSINWGMFVYGVGVDRVVEVSLGYFITPLITMFLGVIFLSERISLVQSLAIVLSVISIVVLTVDYGHIPYIALILGFASSLYAFMKKWVALGTFEGLTIETIILMPIAVAYIVYLSFQGTATVGHHGYWHLAVAIGSGLITAIPQLLFGAAATRIPLVAVGIIQYLAPTLHFLLGVFYFGESMSPARWLGFAIVWIAIVIFMTDALFRHRRALEQSASATTA